MIFLKTVTIAVHSRMKVAEPATATIRSGGFCYMSMTCL